VGATGSPEFSGRRPDESDLAMERSILAELFERGGRGQLSGLRDRRPIERLVNKGFVERHTLNSQQEEYVLTAIGKKVLDNK
jgi:DNA-binding HxlR family transcriptional regulator